MAKEKYLMGLLLLATLVSGNIAAQDVYIYPMKGQSQKQLEQDKFECYSWAKKNTGFDPMQAPQATTPPPAKETPKGGVARGAVGGAVVGGIAGDAGKGAAIGGVVGGTRRHRQVTREQQKQEQWAQEQSAQHQRSRNDYNRAYGACLQGRGYTVK